MLFATYKTHYKETIRLGVPIILGQLGIIIVGFADNIMVGHHSSNELAAASFVNNFFNLIFIFCSSNFLDIQKAVVCIALLVTVGLSIEVI